MIVLLNVMGPIFALIAIGYFFARRRYTAALRRPLMVLATIDR